MSYYLSSNNHGSILVIPEEGDQVTALPAMPTVTIASPFLPSIIAPTTAAVAKDLTVATSTATTSSTSSVRRVSFRTNELEEAKTIASSLVDFADSDYDDDDDDDEEEDCKPASIVCRPLQGQAATAATTSSSSAAPSSTTSAAPASAAPTTTSHTTTSHTTCTRGLELKYSVPRQKRKFTILRSIVKNQRRCSWDQLGLLARKCNVWATHAARVQGLLDYQDASEAKALSRRPLPDMALYPLPLKDKRSSISSSSSSNKRQAEPQEQHAQQTRRVRTKFDPSSIPTKLHNLHNI